MLDGNEAGNIFDRVVAGVAEENPAREHHQNFKVAEQSVKALI